VRSAVTKLQEKYYETEASKQEAPQQLTYSEDIVKISEIKDEEVVS
jgi:hypothetical protein